MQLSPALRYFLLLKTECVLLSTLFSNTLYVLLIREIYWYIHEITGKIVVLDAFAELRKVTNRVINISVQWNNIMHSLFNLLTIKGLSSITCSSSGGTTQWHLVYEYCVRVMSVGYTRVGALIAHPQEALHNGTWYTAFVLCQLAAPGLEWNSRGF
jgi:hypothetical protein